MRHQSRVVTVAAKPEPLAIDTGRTAVLVIDMQNDFGAPGGMFDRAGIDLGPIRRAVGPTAQVLEMARAADLPIVYVNMGYRADLSDTGGPNSPNWIKHAPFQIGRSMTTPEGSEGRVLVNGTWNTAVLDELAPQPGDLIVRKHRYSGFYETELDTLLRSRGVKFLVVTGCTTSICVESTIRDAMFRDYFCLLLEDCTGEPIGHGLPRSNHAASILAIQLLFGWVSDSAGFIEALRRL